MVSTYACLACTHAQGDNTTNMYIRSYNDIPEQELNLEHTPSLRTVSLLQKQPLVQGE